jgi:hypothetical protein
LTGYIIRLQTNTYTKNYVALVFIYDLSVAYL